MKQKLLVLAGKKQSGKSSAANFVAGYVLTQLGRQGWPGFPINYTIDDDGHLVIQTQTGSDILDLNRRDDDFITWAENVMWPNVKLYAYADMLKLFAVTVFGIPEELVYGSDEDKKKKTHIQWKNMCLLISPKQVAEIKRGGKYTERMSVREFLQFFGTNVCRKIYADCWTNACISKIKLECSDLSIIQDCRFANEVHAARAIKSEELDVRVVKLLRSLYKDSHDSETGLDDMKDASFDLIIPPNVTIEEKNQSILDEMYKWGWFETHLEVKI
jgi:hypothetical protein